MLLKERKRINECFFASLCKEALEVNKIDTDINAVIRLGERRDDSVPRPLLVRLVRLNNDKKKSEIMNNVKKMGRQKIARRVRISHDLTVKQRQTINEAMYQANQGDDREFGNLTYKVAGLTWKPKIIKLKKNN